MSTSGLVLFWPFETGAMEPLYAALSFAAVAMVMIQLGRLVSERRAANAAQGRVIAALEPIRKADPRTVQALERAYEIAVSVRTPIYEVTGTVEAAPDGGGGLVVGGVAVRPEAVAAMRDAGIVVDDLLAGARGSDAQSAGSDEAAPPPGKERLVDRFAEGDAPPRHLEFCFAEGDDPRRAPCYVIALDGKRVV